MDQPAQPTTQARPGSAYPAAVAWDMALPPQTLTQALDRAVATFAGRPALDFLGRRITYAQLGAMVDRVAGGLAALGVQRGTRVGLCLPNTPYAVVAYFAVLRAGGIVVNFNPLYVAQELAAQAADSGASVMVTVDLDPILPRVLGLLDTGSVRHVVVCPFAGALPPLKGAALRLLRRSMLAPVPRDPRVRAWRSLLAARPLADPPAVAPDDTAVLQYTGGTTGVAKGAMLTHQNLTANLRQVCAWFPASRPGHERVLAVLPLFHVFAMTVAMNAAIAWGAEIVLLPRFEAAQVRATLRRRRPTIVPGVPTLFKALLDHGTTPAELASVRVCISGGAPMPHEVQRAFDAIRPGVMVEGYGLTESSPVAFCNPTTGGNRLGTIGLPLPGVEACVRALDDPSRAVPDGERGELCLRGPNVMQGYWQRPEETRDAFTPDGWLRTGDVAIAGADGYVTLVDRIKDLIICSGFNVYPRTVEEALYAHPDVAAATALGMPDPYRGESVAAFVQLHPGSQVTEAALRAFLADRLSPIEMPKRIAFRDTLPRTAVGKLSRKELRAELLGDA